MRIILIVYRVLTYIFLGLLVVGLCLSGYEYLYLKHEYGWTGFLVNLSIVFLFMNTYYFLRKTKKIYLLDSESLSGSASHNSFKFDKISGVLNLIIGFSALCLPLYIFYNFPINPIDIEEFLRLSTLTFIGVYGILKVTYTLLTLKRIIGTPE